MENETEFWRGQNCAAWFRPKPVCCFWSVGLFGLPAARQRRILLRQLLNLHVLRRTLHFRFCLER